MVPPSWSLTLNCITNSGEPPDSSVCLLFDLLVAIHDAQHHSSWKYSQQHFHFDAHLSGFGDDGNIHFNGFRVIPVHPVLRKAWSLVACSFSPVQYQNSFFILFKRKQFGTNFMATSFMTTNLQFAISWMVRWCFYIFNYIPVHYQGHLDFSLLMPTDAMFTINWLWQFEKWL